MPKAPKMFLYLVKRKLDQVFFSPNTWQMMTFLKALEALIPKIPFSFRGIWHLGHLLVRLAAVGVLGSPERGVNTRGVYQGWIVEIPRVLLSVPQKCAPSQVHEASHHCRRGELTVCDAQRTPPPQPPKEKRPTPPRVVLAGVLLAATQTPRREIGTPFL